jgi:hypothetical protein
MGLLDVYEQMTKQAHVNELEQERVDVLAKYASVAEDLLQEEYPNNYSQDDVIKLAEQLIINDVNAEEQQAKVAEYVQAGQIMARSFIEEQRKLLS